MKDDMYYAKKLSRMIQCETVSTPDNPNKEKFDSFHSLLKELFPLVFEKCEVIELDSSLLIKWKGETEEDPILLMSHQDVVSAEGEWKYPPFSGEIAEERVWGRGAVDTKASLMCIFSTFEELLEENYKPRHTLYIASSSTEEVAGSGAPKTVEYLLNRGVKLAFLVDEGGMIVDEPMKGVKGRFAMIGTTEKGTGNIVISASSTGGHASAPGRNTPIVRLSRFISDMEDHNPNKIKISETVLEMFSRLGKKTKGIMGFSMRNARLLKPLLSLVLPKISKEANAMVRTTMAFTMCGGSEGRNVLPQKAWVNINTRFIEHQGVEKTKEILLPYLKKYDLEAEYINCKEPQKSVDYNSQYFKMLENVIEEVYPSVIPSPYTMTGGTDAYYYAPLTDNAFRFAPLYIDNDMLKSVHGTNECIFVSSLKKGVEFYKTLIKRYNND